MAYTTRDRYNDEIKALTDAVNRGEVPYGGVSGALSYIYKNYGIPANVSYQEAQGAINDAFKAQPTYIPTQPTAQEASLQDIINAQQEYYNREAAAKAAAQAAADAEALRQRQVAAKAGYDSALGQADYTYGTALDQIGQGRIGVGNEVDKYLQQYQDTEKGLGDSRDKGYTSNATYFENISPDAYQSQVQNYNQKVLDAYNEGMNTVAGNRSKIVDYKNQMEGYYNTQAQRAAEYRDLYKNTALANYNAELGNYTPVNMGDFKSDVAPTAPITTTVTQNPYAGAAVLPGTATWSPNYINKYQDETYKFLK